MLRMSATLKSQRHRTCFGSIFFIEHFTINTVDVWSYRPLRELSGREEAPVLDGREAVRRGFRAICIRVHDQLQIRQARITDHDDLIPVVSGFREQSGDPVSRVKEFGGHSQFLGDLAERSRIAFEISRLRRRFASNESFRILRRPSKPEQVDESDGAVADC